jgi:glycosyltransferase involved in cell wall biosynthesis
VLKLIAKGVLEGSQIVKRLSACDVLLFVRGPISSRRSSAIAGIACGLPVVAYQGPETSPPITEAGVVLVSPDQPDQLHAALVRVLSDRSYREELAERSRAVSRSHFAWSSIASHFSATLKKNS